MVHGTVVPMAEEENNRHSYGEEAGMVPLRTRLKKQKRERWVQANLSYSRDGESRGRALTELWSCWKIQTKRCCWSCHTKIVFAGRRVRGCAAFPYGGCRVQEKTVRGWLL